MDDQEIFEEPFVEETGAATGDHRENDRHCAGFTPAEDRFWRSQFQHANHLADRSYDHVRPAYELGSAAARDERYRGRNFEEIETDLENGWLNVRTDSGEWETVRQYARQAFEAARSTGFARDVSELGGTASHGRPSFSDPVADGVDPTSPASEEQTRAWQQGDRAPADFGLGDQGGFGFKSPTAEDSDRPTP